MNPPSPLEISIPRFDVSLNAAFSSRVESVTRSLAGWRAFFLRELRVALLNRFVHVLACVTLGAGIASLFGEHAGESAPYFLVQAILYLVPLFSLLIGAGSAQGDQEERAFLLTQPVGRLGMVIGKWMALWLLLTLASGLLVLPSGLGESNLAPLAFLWFGASSIGGVFLALGLASGFSTEDRVKAHLGALCLWLVALAGGDLVALAAAQSGWLADQPALWLTTLMVNPLDALRIGALFAIDHVPFDTAHAPFLAQWWLANPGAWVAIISTAWTALALGWCRYRLERMEA